MRQNKFLLLYILRPECFISEFSWKNQNRSTNVEKGDHSVSPTSIFEKENFQSLQLLKSGAEAVLKDGVKFLFSQKPSFKFG